MCSRDGARNDDRGQTAREAGVMIVIITTHPQMLSRARLGPRFAWAASGSCLEVVGRAAGGRACVTGAALLRWLGGAVCLAFGCAFVWHGADGAAFRGSLKGLDVVERAAGGPVLRDRRSTLEIAYTFCGRRSISFVPAEIQRAKSSAAAGKGFDATLVWHCGLSPAAA